MFEVKGLTVSWEQFAEEATECAQHYQGTLGKTSKLARTLEGVIMERGSTATEESVQAIQAGRAASSNVPGGGTLGCPDPALV